ncbi:MAG: hypothetical protein ACKPKO_11835, partial [Candidatus Fonsibacter sp.]
RQKRPEAGALPKMLLAQAFSQPLTAAQQAAFKYSVEVPPQGLATTGKPHIPLPLPSVIGTLRSHSVAVCATLDELAEESASLAAFLR